MGDEMIVALAIVAGGLGALARFEIVERVAGPNPRLQPWATLIVNVAGSFVLGLVVAQLDVDGRAILGTGFSGGFTVYGGHVLEVVEQVERRERLLAACNVIASIAAGTLAAAFGIVAGGA